MGGVYGDPPLCVKEKNLAQAVEDWRIALAVPATDDTVRSER
jgi:hypothetical protein